MPTNKLQLTGGCIHSTRRTFASLLACLSMLGCHTRARTPRLDGTYGVRSGAELEPVLKVELTKTGYAFTEHQTGEWKADLETPHVVSEAEVERALGLTSVTGFYVFGLGTDSVLLLKVPAGWSGGGTPGHPALMTKSGFVLVSNAVAQPAEKIELGSR